MIEPLRTGVGLNRVPAGRGFTLVELLTVITIMALLVSILVPSLNKARMTAKRTASRAVLHGLESDIEVFRQATDEYPDSENGYYYRNDKDPWGNTMNGATKLARALLGPEAAAGSSIGSVPPKRLRQSSDPKADFYDTPDPRQRIGPFTTTAQLGKNYFPIDDPDLPYTGPNQLPQVYRNLGGTTLPKPMIFVDSFLYPVLYYKAHPTATRLAIDKCSNTGNTETGYYCHDDNIYFTGDGSGGPDDGWELELGEKHNIRFFGDPVNPDAPRLGDPTLANNFCEVLHQHSEQAQNATEMLRRMRKPYNADSFLLWTPGPDGIYGTPDDVRNFGE